MDMKLFNRHSAVKHYFLNGIRKNYIITILITALHLLSFPVMFGILLIEGKDSTLYLGEIYCVFACIFVAIAALAGVIIAINSFSYLHKKHESDTYLSFPLSTNQRFFCDYLSGFVSYIVPAVVGFVATLIMGSITHMAFGGIYIDTESAYSIIDIIVELYAAGISVMAMLYTLTVLVTTLCGSLFEVIMHNVLVNGLIPGMIAIFMLISFDKAIGVPIYDIIPTLISKTSPIGALIGAIIRMDYSYYYDFSTYGILPSGFSLWILFFTVIYLALAFFLYRKRKAEDVSKPFVFKAFYYIIISCITFIICAIIPYETDVLIIPVMIAAIVFYLIFEVISKRGFKKFKFSLLRSIVTVVGSILLIGILSGTNTFNAAKRIPEADDVKSASINYYGTGNFTDIYDSTPIVYTDEDCIQLIINLHQKTLDKIDFSRNIFLDYGYYWDYYEYYHTEDCPCNPDIQDDYYNVECSCETNMYTITYKLKNGMSYTREYHIARQDIASLTALENSDEYRKQLPENVVSRFKANGEFRFNTYPGGNIFYIESYDYGRDTVNKEFDVFMDDFAEAFRKDIESRTYEQIKTPSTPIGSVSSYDFNFYIYEYDVNTVELLEKYGAFDSNEDHETALYNELTEMVVQEVSSGSETGGSPNYVGYYPDYKNYDIDSVIKLQNKFINATVPYNYNGNYIYSVYVQTDNFWGYLYIPEENAHIAKEYIDACIFKKPNYSEFTWEYFNNAYLFYDGDPTYNDRFYSDDRFLDYDEYNNKYYEGGYYDEY